MRAALVAHEVPGAEGGAVRVDEIALEDQELLEGTKDDYELDLLDLVHLKVDRGTIALRKIYREIVETDPETPSA